MMLFALAILFAIANALLSGFMGAKALSAADADTRPGLWFLAGAFAANALVSLTYYTLHTWDS